MAKHKPRMTPAQRAGRRARATRRRASPASAAPYWLYGRHAVAAALANPARICHRLLAVDAADAAALAAGTGLAPEIVDRASLAAVLPPGAVHQGVGLYAEPLAALHIDNVCAAIAGRDDAVVIVLDQVSDPQNVGAILRSAAAFGVTALVMQDRHAPPASGTLAKAASGGLEHTALVRVTNLARAITALKEAGLWAIGLDAAAAPSLAAARPRGAVALVLGAEGRGLRRLTREACDALARLPMPGSAAVASLNVAAAAAVALYELRRPGATD